MECVRKSCALCAYAASHMRAGRVVNNAGGQFALKSAHRSSGRTSDFHALLHYWTSHETSMNRGGFRCRPYRASRAVPLAIETEGPQRQVHRIGRLFTNIAHSCDLPGLETSLFGHVIAPCNFLCLAGSGREPCAPRQGFRSSWIYLSMSLKEFATYK